MYTDRHQDTEGIGPRGDEYMNSARISYYTSIIDQMSLLGIFAKQQYLRNRASGEILQIIRECIINVHAGNIRTTGIEQHIQKNSVLARHLNRPKLGDRSLRYLLSQIDALTHFSLIIPYLRIHLGN